MISESHKELSCLNTKLEHLQASGNDSSQDAIQKKFRGAVSIVLMEAGFSSAKKSSIEFLMELLKKFITDVGGNARSICDLAGRSDIAVSDVDLALMEIGFDRRTLHSYLRCPHRPQLPSLPPTSVPNPQSLSVGDTKPLPSSAPSYLPNLPDPHTYIGTTAKKDNESELKSIREKLSSQRREIERGLTRFIAKTGDTETMFHDDPYAYPLIANKPKPLSYLDVLCPKDHDVEPEEPRLDISRNTDIDIDNPYLRDIKMPKLRANNKKTTLTKMLSTPTATNPSSYELFDQDDY